MTVLPMQPVDPALLSRALDVAGRLANDAAEVIAATAGRGSVVGGVGPFDWVTDTDRTLERHTRRVLATEFPAVPVLGGGLHAAGHGAPHDDPGSPPARLRWVVGGPGETRCGSANYAAGFPWYAYSLALVDASGPVVGVLADPSRAQIYAAARGRGMRANGVAVPARAPVGGLVCCELSPGVAAGFLAAARTGVRTLGSAALAITQVALGNAVAAVVDGYREWDVAGALCLATEAGAAVVDALGRPEPLPTGGLLVAWPDTLEVVAGWWRAASAA